MRHVTIVDGATVFVDGNDEYNDPAGLTEAETEIERLDQVLLNKVLNHVCGLMGFGKPEDRCIACEDK